MASVSHGKRCG